MPCLLCNSPKVKRLETLCCNMRILGDSYPDTSSHISACQECGLVFVEMDVTQNDILSYYTSDYCGLLCYADSFGAKRAEQYFEQILASISPYVTKESHILDVGGGLGEFAAFLMEKGYKNVALMDPANASISSAAQKGIRTIQADSTQQVESESGRYDIILMLHVFEHIYAQKETLENMKEMLKPDGFLYLEVPDASKFCNDGQMPYYYYTYEHVAHMTWHDLVNIASITGMELLECKEYMKSITHYPSVYGIFRNGNEIKKLVYHDLGENSAKNYLKLCKSNSRQMGRIFRENQDTLVLWGIGASTAQLVGSCFDQCKVRALVDNNPKRQGISFKVGDKKLAIISPSELKNTIHDSDIIVVMPIIYKETIVRQIKEMGFRHRIETLSLEVLPPEK